jgi:hypothetical protein
VSSTSKFRSQRLEGRRVILSFQQIGDTQWTHVGALREFVAELDRLEVQDDADVQLKAPTDDDWHVVGWSLRIFCSKKDTS